MFSLVLMISFLELLARVTGVALSLLVVFITVQRISAHELPGWLPCCKQGGVIEVGAATRCPAMLRLWVRETGVGLDPRAESGTGLANLRARLGAMYGAAASLQFTAVAPHGVHAELHIPAEVHLRGRSDKLPVSRSWRHVFRQM